MIQLWAEEVEFVVIHAFICVDEILFLAFIFLHDVAVRDFVDNLGP